MSQRNMSHALVSIVTKFSHQQDSYKQHTFQKLRNNRAQMQTHLDPLHGRTALRDIKNVTNR
eukprot:CCRYP_019755-RA/>CCRYP_019755-RA protein AED:0.47 eAED:0.47 QI:60/1/0.5/1/0/0/2/0/61